MGAERGILISFFLSLNRACEGPQQPLTVTYYPLYSSVYGEIKRVPRKLGGSFILSGDIFVVLFGETHRREHLLISYLIFSRRLLTEHAILYIRLKVLACTVSSISRLFRVLRFVNNMGHAYLS